MSNSTKSNQPSPKGPEGVPVDAPDNDAPALSPHAVSRMHRAEDDEAAIAESPDYSDARSLTKEAARGAGEAPSVENDDRRDQEGWAPGAPGSGRRDDASRGLDSATSRGDDPNPAHNTAKRDSERPRGAGDGELMEQPESTSEARQRGPDRE